MNIKLYGGIDLHSNNSVVVLLNEIDKIVYHKRLSNNMDEILAELAPYKNALEGLVVESIYNWYWQVDGLQAAGYKVHLANTAAIQPYSGLKHTDDKDDATWLAKLLRLGILEEGYMYPKEARGVRELLRRRMVLTKQQTMCVLGIQAIIARYENIKLTADKIKRCKNNGGIILNHVKDQYVKLAVQAQLTVLHCAVAQIDQLEVAILNEIKEDDKFKLLKTMPGIGSILAMTILLETGDIKRFANPGNYSSYCRCVESKRISNAKKKGENNRKNGNKYLSWAFVEAANYAIRYYEPIKRYYQRKLDKTNRIVAIKTIANKLSKACFFILRDEVEFDMNKLFT